LESGSGSFAFNFSGGTLEVGGSFNDLTTSVPIALPTSGSRGTIYTDGNSLELDGPITGPGGLVLADSSNGALILTASNSYRGGTAITGGVLEIGNAAALGGGGVAVDGGTLDLYGYSVTLPSLSGAAGTITNNGGFLAILTVSQSATTTFAGSLQDGAGPLALVMDGKGKLVLAGTNAFSGGTTVESGTLVVSGYEALVNSSDLMVGNPTLLAEFDPVLAASGAQPSALPATAVPEPGTLQLLVILLLGVLWRAFGRQTPLCAADGKHDLRGGPH
jgi:autotransporter-associated beta strand protein